MIPRAAAAVAAVSTVFVHRLGDRAVRCQEGRARCPRARCRRRRASGARRVGSVTRRPAQANPIKWLEPAMETTPSLVTVRSISTASPGRATAVPLACRSAGRSGSGPAGRAPRIARWVRSSGTSRDRTVRRTSPVVSGENVVDLHSDIRGHRQHRLQNAGASPAFDAAVDLAVALAWVRRRDT